MTELLDDPRFDHVVLVNNQRQHSLWPASVATPQGWVPAYGPASRGDCLDYVRQHWADIRPANVPDTRCDHRSPGTGGRLER
ncbi:MbtH family protein [Streptomonospora alba]|uniref:MbtH family protein n=1 Tax=Streptomonospora alba TaxID=183763 RepID=UPI000A02FB84|nr:MbtH family NRPS accessory protein [Streptomonospora alba]